VYKYIHRHKYENIRNDFTEGVTSSVMTVMTADVRERINPICFRNIISPGFSLAMPCKDTTILCDPVLKIANTELGTSEFPNISLTSQEVILV
jgi:hypothetical protein